MPDYIDICKCYAKLVKRKDDQQFNASVDITEKARLFFNFIFIIITKINPLTIMRVRDLLHILGRFIYNICQNLKL